MKRILVSLVLLLNFQGNGILAGEKLDTPLCRGIHHDPSPSSDLLSLESPTAGGGLTSKNENSESDPYKIPIRREFPFDTSVDPCSDFHKYVCNKAESTFKLRPDRSRHMFAFSDSSERLLEVKKNFFKNITGEKNLGTRGEGLKAYYAACMNEKAGAADERNFLKELNKELDKIDSPESFAHLMISNIANGKQSVIGVGNDENKDDSSKYDFHVAVNFMLLYDHSYYENTELMAAYKKLVTKYMLALNPGISMKQATVKAERIINLQKEFIKTYPQKAVRRERMAERHEITQDGFVAKYPNLQMGELFEKLPKASLIQAPIEEALQFYSQHLTEKYLPALKDFYQFITGYGIIDDSNTKLFAEKFAFNNKFLGGPEKRSERQERCTSAMMGTFEKEIDEILLPRQFPNFPEEKLIKVADLIRKSILDGLEKNEWLSDQARKEAIKKMTVAKLKLVKPQNEKEWDFLPIVSYDPLHPIENAIKLERALFIKMFAEHREPVFPDKWLMGPLTVNAYYNPAQNQFVLPAGILQYPFFDSEGGILENLGGVGAVIGHELGHGIDDQGSKYDDKGSLRQWMTEKDLVTFKARGKKLIDQFAKVKHDGALTLGENTADLVGVTFAYNAAFPKGKGSIEDKRKFFEAYARLWCGVALPKMEERLLKTDPHAMGWARINEQVKHQPGFAEAYSCKDGSPMTLPREERVKIW